MEDSYHQQQQYYIHAHGPQREDNISGNSNSNVAVIEYLQPGVAVEKVYHLQVCLSRL